MDNLFEMCVRKGGDVKTKSLPDDRYQRLCILGTNTYFGPINKKKKK